MCVTCEGHCCIPAMFCSVIGLFLLTESSMPDLSEACKHVTNLLSVTKEIFHRGWVVWLYGFVVWTALKFVFWSLIFFIFSRWLLASFMSAYLFIISCPGHIWLRHSLILHVESRHISTRKHCRRLNVEGMMLIDVTGMFSVSQTL